MLPVNEELLDRMVRAVENVRDRLRRAAAALEAARIPYAVIGGNAVAAWVARVDEAAVRNTQDVDILLRRSDPDAAKEAFARAGFVYRHINGIDIFLDGARGRARDAVHIVFAGEKVHSEDLVPAPEVDECEDDVAAFRVVALQPLARMMLASYRREDRMSLRDMIDVGLVDETWPARLPAPLAERLEKLLDDPEG